MAARNSYFQLQFKENKVYLHVYPPVDGGEELQINEVIRYLDGKRLSSYNLKELNRAVTDLENESDVLVGNWDGIEVNEMMDWNVSQDKMEAICRFYPPSKGGKKVDAQEIINDLVSARIKYGMDQNAIFDFLSNPKYCTDYIMAKGKRAVHGTDARIEYYFNTDINLSPKHNEDGTVDYHELNTISAVNKGDLIAKLIKENPGEVGYDVFGAEIKPRLVKTAKLSYGNNIEISEDETELYSLVTGHAQLVGGKVFVSDVYEVPADVDNSTGNIDYAGSVEVKGNVKGGFTVKAHGDIIVEGVVEDATLIADGQIIVKRGIHGMTKGYMKAGKSIVSKFIENATVVSNGYVETEIIMHSKVDAKSYVKVHGKKGLINGGVVRAGNLIEADNIGSEMGGHTQLEVGIDPERKIRYGELQKQIAQMNEELSKSKTIIMTYGEKMAQGVKLSPDKLMFIQKLTIDYKERKKLLEPLTEEFEQLHDEMLIENSASIRVNKRIYSGTVICISDLSIPINKDDNYCQYVKGSGEIERKSL